MRLLRGVPGSAVPRAGGGGAASSGLDGRTSSPQPDRATMTRCKPRISDSRASKHGGRVKRQGGLRTSRSSWQYASGHGPGCPAARDFNAAVRPPFLSPERCLQGSSHLTRTKKRARAETLPRFPGRGGGREPSSDLDFISRWDLMQTPARARFKRLMVAVLRGTDGLAVLDQSEALKGRDSHESARAATKALDPYTVQDRLPRRWSFGRREHP